MHVYAIDGDGGILVTGALSTNNGGSGETHRGEVGVRSTMWI